MEVIDSELSLNLGRGGGRGGGRRPSRLAPKIDLIGFFFFCPTPRWSKGVSRL